MRQQNQYFSSESITGGKTCKILLDSFAVMCKKWI